jgi:hypothetical protein
VLTGDIALLENLLLANKELLGLLKSAVLCKSG